MQVSGSISGLLTARQQALVIRYLYITGGLTACALAFALLLFVAYLAQLCLLTIGEVVHTFNSLDPLVRLLILALVTVLVFWRLSHYWRAQGYGKH